MYELYLLKNFLSFSILSLFITLIMNAFLASIYQNKLLIKFFVQYYFKWDKALRILCGLNAARLAS